MEIKDKSLEELLNGNQSNPTNPSPAPSNGGDGTGGNQPTNPGANQPAPSSYKVGNRELTPDQLFEEYNKLQGAYTQTTQENAELKKKGATPTPPQSNGEQLSAEDQAIVKEMTRLGFKRGEVLTKEDFNKALAEKEPELIQKASRVTSSTIELKEALGQLEDDFDGSIDPATKIPKPKVDKQKVIDFIVANPNTNLSPLEIAKVVYHDDFVKYEAKVMVGNGGGTPNVPETENGGTGAGGGNPPAPAYTFKDGSVERGLEAMFVKK